MPSEAQHGLSRSSRSGSLFSRRRFLLLTAGAGAALIGACGGGSETTPAPTSASGGTGSSGTDTTATATATQAGSDTTATSTGSAGGTKTFTYGVAGNISTMHPGLGASYVGALLGEAIYNTVGRVAYNPPMSLEINPELGTWEITPDAKTYTFHIRTGVQYHSDYGELTAEDIAWNWNELKNPDNASIAQANFAGSTITAPDTETLIVTFDTPNPGFMLSTVTDTPCMIISPKAYEETKESWNTKPIGSGPFEWVEWQPNSQVTLKRFDGYWGQKPNLDQIVCKLSADDRTAPLAVSKGELDAYFIMSTDVALDIQKNPLPNTKFLRSAQGSTPMWAFLNLKREPFQDIRVRHAFRYAVDIESIAKDLFGGLADPIHGFLPPWMPGYTEDVMQFPYDPDKARTLLEEANYPFDSFVPSILTDSTVDRQVMGSTVIQQYLSDIGVKTKLDLNEKGNFGEKRKAGEYDLVTLAVGRKIPDQLSAPFFHSGAPGNYAFYDGADDLIDAAQAEVDDDKKAQRYVDVLKKVAEDSPAIFLVASAEYLIYNTNTIVGEPPVMGTGRRLDWFNLDVAAT